MHPSIHSDLVAILTWWQGDGRFEQSLFRIEFHGCCRHGPAVEIPADRHHLLWTTRLPESDACIGDIYTEGDRNGQLTCGQLIGFHSLGDFRDA